MIEQLALFVATIRFDYGGLRAIVIVILLLGVLMMDVEKYISEIRKALGNKKH